LSLIQGWRKANRTRRLQPESPTFDNSSFSKYDSNMLKRTVFVLVAGVSAGVLYPDSKADAGSVSEVRMALEMWAPKAVVRNGTTIKVVLPQRRITEQIYTAAISAGICLYVAAKKIRLAGVKEIQILNQFRRQGYVFEGGKKERDEMNRLPRSGQKIQLLGRTHLYLP